MEEESATWECQKRREHKGRRIFVSGGGVGGFLLLSGALVAAASVLGFTVRVLGKKRNLEKEEEEERDSLLQCLSSPTPSSSDLPPPPSSTSSDNKEDLQSVKDDEGESDVEGHEVADTEKNSSSESEETIWPAEASDDSSSSSSLEDVISHDCLLKLRFDAIKYAFNNNKETQQSMLVGKGVPPRNSNKVFFQWIFAFVFALVVLLFLMAPPPHRRHHPISQVIYSKGASSPEL